MLMLVMTLMKFCFSVRCLTRVSSFGGNEQLHRIKIETDKRYSCLLNYYFPPPIYNFDCESTEVSSSKLPKPIVHLFKYRTNGIESTQHNANFEFYTLNPNLTHE